jgi:hypothetical protein
MLSYPTMRRTAQHGTFALFLLYSLGSCAEARQPTRSADAAGKGSEAERGATPIDSGIAANEAGPQPVESGSSSTPVGGNGGARAAMTMGAAGSGSGSTGCRPLPCPSGAAWHAQTCACEGTASGAACMVDSDCVLVFRGCCACPPRDLMSVIATNQARLQEVQDAQCGGPVCSCPASEYDPLAAILRATCVDYQCAAIDLRQVALSKCSQDSDCVAEGLGCCGATSGEPMDYVGVHKDADDSILQCVPAPPCVPTPPPAPPPVAFCANDGHCAVRKHEKADGIESTSCYSPSQNLDHAYDAGAAGCDCRIRGAPGLCRQDSLGRFVGLLCSDQGHWKAVNDGPCGKMP